MADQPDITKRTFFERLFGLSPKAVAESHKELRFTRTRQASQFFILTAFLLVLGVASFVALYVSWGPKDLDFRLYAWFCLTPLIPSYFTLRLAIHCVRYAYILLTPMGVEVFPFFQPEKNLQIIFWQEVDSFDISPSLLTLHSSPEKTSGTVLTLKPLAPAQISLLRKAIEARTNHN
ncbi:MAG: hypothetical protein ABGY95_10155 [Rubritalea sp.]|uniref:hypothetical protein n=1 Tax=Rubritalea sp. TaxID=2109375 RepID=UPI0032429DC0